MTPPWSPRRGGGSSSEGRVRSLVAPGDVQSAFAQAAAEDGIVLGSGSFDWLCEQGHVGLERVAKARRDPALVAPVTAALERLAAIYARLGGDVSVLHASRENLLLPVDLVHEPTGTVIEVDEPPHFTSFRLAALELYPADAALGFDLDEHKELCRAWCAKTDGLAAASRPRASASAACSANGHTTTRSSTSQLRPWAIRRSSGSRPSDGDGAAAYRAHRAALRRCCGCLSAAPSRRSRRR